MFLLKFMKNFDSSGIYWSNAINACVAEDVTASGERPREKPGTHAT